MLRYLVTDSKVNNGNSGIKIATQWHVWNNQICDG
jgi:hypothetical protein